MNDEFLNLGMAILDALTNDADPAAAVRQAKAWEKESGIEIITPASDAEHLFALAHAQHGRWDQAIPLYREVFVRLARLNTDSQGAKSKPAWDAAEKLLESGDLALLESSLEVWWRTFVIQKPKPKQGS